MLDIIKSHISKIKTHNQLVLNLCICCNDRYVLIATCTARVTVWIPAVSQAIRIWMGHNDKVCGWNMHGSIVFSWHVKLFLIISFSS